MLENNVSHRRKLLLFLRIATIRHAVSRSHERHRRSHTQVSARIRTRGHDSDSVKTGFWRATTGASMRLFPICRTETWEFE